MTVEASFDGLVGPTHGYAGLSPGNVASLRHGGQVSSPKRAALEGLAKMRFVRALGVPQGVLPPHDRPSFALLRRLGFEGTTAAILDRAGREAPHLLAASWSASAMWTANAATVAPSADASDRRVHFTPANLQHNLHRAIEVEQTALALRRVFASEQSFAHHPPLPASAALGDEGAANHTRLGAEEGGGLHLFVYGRAGGAPGGPQRFPARQTLEASRAVARLHRLSPERVIFARQAPEVIDAGVFHNDVICVGHRGLLFFHQRAFAEPDVLDRLKAALPGLRLVEVPEARVSIEDAVSTYLFNSQLVTDAEGRVRLVAPSDVLDRPAVAAYVAELVADPGAPIDAVDYLELRQSMQNGGGPACLRLRVWLEPEELAAVHPPCLLDDAGLDALEAWVERHYRDRLAPDDLRDPALVEESRAALDELTRLLSLGGDFYPFQRP
jgi:succinylarginine dihydrolase